MSTVEAPPRHRIDYLDLRDRIANGEPHTELLTRRQTAEFLSACGFPISEATLMRFCMPSDYSGPPTACYWGQRAMHRPEDALAWARARAARRHSDQPAEAAR
jgi:hypothetical protein